MNENLDLTKILDGCPVGTEFYSSIYGKCYFAGIANNENYPIKLSFYNKDYKYRNDQVARDGRHRVEYDGDCILFPSKDQRDWSKFERFWDKPKVEKFDPKTFQPFDKVLARDDRKDIWGACLFSHPGNNLSEGWFVCDNTYWHYIIPYNEETKHLIGTNNDCPDYYKWWEE